MNVITAPAPSPTRDIDQAKSDLDKFGFCLITGVLEGRALQSARQRLLDQAAGEQEQGRAFRDGGREQRLVDDFGAMREDAFTAENGGVNQRLWMLANKGQCFRDMIVHPLVDALVGHILGAEFILSTLSANIARAGGVRMGLHTDQWWMPQPVRAGDDFVRASEITRSPADGFVAPDAELGIAPPVVANTMWMLSDFTVENGATEVVPGSHVSGAHPNPKDQSNTPIVQATGEAGTLLVFDGRLWHGTGANVGGEERLGVLATFCAPQFRQQENQTIGLDPALWDKIDDKLKARLGFKVWNAYGRVESPAMDMVDRDPLRIGELQPKSKS